MLQELETGEEFIEEGQHGGGRPGGPCGQRSSLGLCQLMEMGSERLPTRPLLPGMTVRASVSGLGTRSAIPFLDIHFPSIV